MKPRDIPNIISFFRIVLVVPVVISILQGRFQWALVLFVVAGVSDGVDGLLARRYGWQSRLGSLLDPAADKLLIVCSYVTGGWLDLIPGWVVIAVVIRDAIIVCGAIASHYFIQPLKGNPLLWSKLNTFFQLSLLFFVLLNLTWVAIPATAFRFLYVTVMVTTVLSGLFYIVVWGKMLLEKTAD